MPTSSNRPSALFSSESSRSPWSTLISTECWLSVTVVKICDLRVGIVELRSISLVNSPPRVSMPSESGVTSSSTRSLISPSTIPPWIAAPTATTSSGLISREGVRPKNSATARATSGIRVCPPVRMTCCTCSGFSAAASRALRHGSSVERTRSPTSSSSCSRVSAWLRCSACVPSVAMNGSEMFAI